MKVYVATINENHADDGIDLLGVFSTMEKAKTVISKAKDLKKKGYTFEVKVFNLDEDATMKSMYFNED